MCAAAHARSYRTCQLELLYEYCRHVILVVIIRTRYRAGGAWGGERAGAIILCVHRVVLQRKSGAVACSAACNLAPPFHNWSTNGVDHKQSNYGPLCFVSYWYLLA